MPGIYKVEAKGHGGKKGSLDLPTMPEKIEEFLEGLGAERAPEGTGSGFDPYFAGYVVTGGWRGREFRPTAMVSAFDLNDIATLAAYYGNDALEAADIAAKKAAEKGVPATARAFANFLMQADDMPIRASYESSADTPEERFVDTVLRKITVGEALSALGHETDAGALADVSLSRALSLLGVAKSDYPLYFAEKAAFPGKTVVLREYGYAVPDDDFRPDPGRYSAEDIRSKAAALRSKAAALRSKALEKKQSYFAPSKVPTSGDLVWYLGEVRKEETFLESPEGLRIDDEYEGSTVQEKRRGYDVIATDNDDPYSPVKYGFVAVPEEHPLHGADLQEAQHASSFIEFAGRIRPDDNRWWLGVRSESYLGEGGEPDDADLFRKMDSVFEGLERMDPQRDAARENAAAREETAPESEAGREEAASETAAPRAEGEGRPAAAKEDVPPTREGGGTKRIPPRRGRNGEGTLAEKQAALRREVCEQLADDIENLGEAWAGKWAQPGGMPQNPVTGVRYGGGNAAALMCAARQKGFSDNRWCSFDDAKDMGWRVRKGEKGTRIEHWKPVEVDDGLDPANPDRTGHVTRHMKLHSIRPVFNFEQIDGAPQLDLSNLAALRATSAEAVLAVADALKASSRCGVVERSTLSAFYSPAAGGIVMPKREQFSRPEAFVSALLREMARSTAPALGSSAAGRFAAGEEELTAELSSMIAAASLGVGYDAERLEGSEKRAASLELCADAMRRDPDVLFRCAGNAQRAAKLVVERFDVAAALRGLSRPFPVKLEKPAKTRPVRAARMPKTESLDDKFAAAKTSCEAVNAHRGGGHGGHGDDPR